MSKANKTILAASVFCMISAIATCFLDYFEHSSSFSTAYKVGWWFACIFFFFAFILLGCYWADLGSKITPLGVASLALSATPVGRVL